MTYKMTAMTPLDSANGAVLAPASLPPGFEMANGHALESPAASVPLGELITAPCIGGPPRDIKMSSMNDAQFIDLCAWIAEAGLAGQSEAATLDGFCERALEVGLPLARANVVIDTLHPVYEGRAFVWKRKTRKTSLTEFGRATVDIKRWENSPFYDLEISGEPMLRRRLTAETENEFPIFPELRSDGITDYVAITKSFRRGRNRRRYGLRLFVLGHGY